MKIVICGGRNNFITNQGYDKLIRIHNRFKFTEIITGGAKGIDTCAANWAVKNSIKSTIVKPDWSLGRKAGPLRNTEMLKMIEDQGLLITFKGGFGTLDCNKQAKFFNIPIIDLTDEKYSYHQPQSPD